ncbi:MAG TPA: hypothetical protein VK145_00005, partial [Candidatus Nanoarchaeia archaeon]|nr:hypothetical protein [Candidatus Nanoarchaeia archaeon]
QAAIRQFNTSFTGYNFYRHLFHTSSSKSRTICTNTTHSSSFINGITMGSCYSASIVGDYILRFILLAVKLMAPNGFGFCFGSSNQDFRLERWRLLLKSSGCKYLGCIPRHREYGIYFHYSLHRDWNHSWSWRN